MRGFLASSLLLIVFVRPAMTAEPKPTPQRYVPARGLVGYVEFDGIRAHAEAWQATAAYAMLAKTPAGAMMTQIARQVTDRMLKIAPAGKLTGADLVALQDHLVHEGFAVGLHRHGDDIYSWTIVLNGAGREGSRERYERLLEPVLTPAPPARFPTPMRLRERNVYQLKYVEEASRDGVIGPVAATPTPEGPATEVPWLSWWFENDDLVLISVPLDAFRLTLKPALVKRSAEVHTGQLTAVLDVLEGKMPNVTTHPAYVAAVSEGKDIKGFESNGLFFIDAGKEGGLFRDVLERRSVSPLSILSVNLSERRAASGLSSFGTPPPGPAPSAFAPGGQGPHGNEPGIAPAEGKPKVSQPRAAGLVAAKPKDADPAKLLGLDGVKRIVGRWGFQGKALLTDLRIEAPAPRKGLVSWLDQPAFDRDRLPPIPRATGTFVVDSFDPAATYRSLVALIKTADPETAGEVDQLEQMLRGATGLRLREDLLGHLGPHWCVMDLPSAARAGERKEAFDPASQALVVGVDDPASFMKVLDDLAGRANQYLRDCEKTNAGQAPGGREADPPMLALEKLRAPSRGYRLTSPAHLVFWLNDDVQPTILVGKSHVALAANPGRAAEALAPERDGRERWRPTGELIKAFECLPDKLTLLAIVNAQDSIVPGLIAALPRYVQILSDGLGDLEQADATTPTEILAMFGVPRPGAFRVRISSDQVPSVEDLQAHVFPSVLAAAVDGQGIQFILREAFPLACTGNRAYVKSSLKWTGAKGLRRDTKLGFGWFSGQ